MDGQVTIDALVDETGVRYIGQTRGTMAQRLQWHSAARNSDDCAKNVWLRELLNQGQKPTIEMVETVATALADEAERRQIAAHRARGYALLNGTLGGLRRAREHKHRARQQDFHRISLRLPLELHEELRRRSVSEERSLHAEIIHGLREYTGQGPRVVRRRRAGRATREAS